MENKALTITPAEMGGIEISAGAVAAYMFARDKSGLVNDEESEADFVSRRNLLGPQFRDLWETLKRLEKFTKDAKEIVEHAFNVGGADDIQNDDGVKISWGKQSFTYDFADGAGSAVANALVKKNLVTKDALLDCVTVSAMAKTAGLKVEKLIDMFPGTVLEKPKKRTLSIK